MTCGMAIGVVIMAGGFLSERGNMHSLGKGAMARAPHARQGARVSDTWRGLPRMHRWRDAALLTKSSKSSKNSRMFSQCAEVEADKQAVSIPDEDNQEKSWDAKYSSERGQLRYGAWMMQGLRDTMEDNYDVIDRARCGFLYASVFDGHGGKAASDYLKGHLYEVFNRAIEREWPTEVAPLTDAGTGLSCPIELTRLLTEMFEETDKDLLKYLTTIDDDYQSRSGSTATVTLVRKDRIIVANVGDSRAVLGRGDFAIDLSKEHRAFGDSEITWNEIARIEDVGAWVDDGRVLDILGITRAFGDPDFKGEGLHDLKKMCVDLGYWAEEFAESLEFTGDPIIVTPDVTEIAVTPEDDILIVASDGLWDVYDSDEAIAITRSLFEDGASPEDVARTLCETAIEHGTEDNVVAIVIDLKGLHGDSRSAASSSSQMSSSSSSSSSTTTTTTTTSTRTTPCSRKSSSSSL